MNVLIKDIIDLHENKNDVLKTLTSPKVGWLSINTPEEILYAAGLVPYRIDGAQAQMTPKAGELMHRNICSYVLSCLEEGLDGVHDSNDGVVIVNACDARRRLYEVWDRFVKPEYIYFLDFPKTVNAETKKYFSGQLRLFIESIEQHFQCRISDESLRQAISYCNESRALLHRLYQKRKKDNPPVTGAQSIKIVQAGMSGLKKDFNEKLSKLLLTLDSIPEKKALPQRRILLCGSYFDHTEIIDIIEQNGAIVVCEDLSNGIKYFENQVCQESDPVEALSEYYLEKATSARMTDSKKRFSHMHDLITEYNADSVIYFSLKFCDNNLMDFPYLKKRLNEHGIPVLFLEIERTMANLEQIKTRIQTFLES